MHYLTFYLYFNLLSAQNKWIKCYQQLLIDCGVFHEFLDLSKPCNAPSQSSLFLISTFWDSTLVNFWHSLFLWSAFASAFYASKVCSTSKLLTCFVVLTQVMKLALIQALNFSTIYSERKQLFASNYFTVVLYFNAWLYNKYYPTICYTTE